MRTVLIIDVDPPDYFGDGFLAVNEVFPAHPERLVGLPAQEDGFGEGRQTQKRQRWSWEYDLCQTSALF